MARPSNVFGLVWNSRVISFASNEHEDETWTTGTKIQEKRRPEVSRPLSSIINSIPEASATFECFNYMHHTSGNLKVVIQMPYSGSESEPWQSRGEQATSKLSDPLRAELESLIRRKHESSSAAPMLFLWKVEKQTSAMPVPGGYVVYIITEYIKKEIPRKPLSWRRLSYSPFTGTHIGTRRATRAYDSEMRCYSNRISDPLTMPPRKALRRDWDDNWS